MKQIIPRDTIMEAECFRLAKENAALLDIAHLAAAGPRMSGNYSNSRAELETKATDALVKAGLLPDRDQYAEVEHILNEVRGVIL